MSRGEMFRHMHDARASQKGKSTDREGDVWNGRPCGIITVIIGSVNNTHARLYAANRHVIIITEIMAKGRGGAGRGFKLTSGELLPVLPAWPEAFLSCSAGSTP